MNFERPQLIRDEIYQLLRHQILSGGIQPGARIAEIELCERFGVSRTPIREAIQRLVQEGMLEANANKSVRVRVLSAEEARQSYQVREALDGLAAELAAQNYTDEDAGNLKDALHDLKVDREDYKEQTRLDLLFHRKIALASHNQTLLQSLNNLEHTVAIIKHMTGTYNLMPETTVQHEAILEAILQRNVREAGQLARDHVRFFGDLVVQQLHEMTRN
ncbi:GntR family transcriptional regulator [Deinococcus roseus]|uniref:GntR family transcriptional regulator n=1 Tax=Deinococcus roseus TaxID=392414 RepID=A0ABQ2CUQ7_9DEIO|nr:GntR family transcriptional regulator [Deinococcus roseus]GGJ22427.1 GntR family transcriptional regulator [Deinococcus roseus]